ncbi:MAG: hypothetical protein IPI67_38625 [Myxococcales bacterium]|nr:hypothetical protein [Myxococcales bacterium]
MKRPGGRGPRLIGVLGLTLAAAVACGDDAADSGGRVTRFFGGSVGGGTGGGAGDAGATCNGIECPPPPAAAAGLAEPCCQTNDSCGFKIPSIGQECLPPADTDASNLDPDCPSVTWQGKTLAGCCLPDGKTCGAVESLVGTGCLDAALFGVAATVDCDGNPVTGTGGTGGTGTGGTGTGGTGTGGTGTGGTGTGGTGTGGTGTGGTGTGGTGACVSCSIALNVSTSDPTKICAGAELTNWNSLKNCACSDGTGKCLTECGATVCVNKSPGAAAACKTCLQSKCVEFYMTCTPA